MFHPAIQFKIVLEQDSTGIKQRNDRVRENFIHLDHRSHETVEATVFDGSGKANAEDLQNAAHLIGEVDGFLG